LRGCDRRRGACRGTSSPTRGKQYAIRLRDRRSRAPPHPSKRQPGDAEAAIVEDDAAAAGLECAKPRQQAFGARPATRAEVANVAADEAASSSRSRSEIARAVVAFTNTALEGGFGAFPAEIRNAVYGSMAN